MYVLYTYQADATTTSAMTTTPAIFPQGLLLFFRLPGLSTKRRRDASRTVEIRFGVQDNHFYSAMGGKDAPALANFLTELGPSKCVDRWIQGYGIKYG
jgi:hypothetical protein